MVIAVLVKNKHLNAPNAYYYQKMTVFNFTAPNLNLFTDILEFISGGNQTCGRFDFGYGYGRICAP